MKTVGMASRLLNDAGEFILSALPDSDMRENSRRVTRHKTLDGGVVITDSGFAHGDRTIILQVTSGEALWDDLWDFFQNTADVTLSIDDGCFLAVIENMAEIDGRIFIKLLIKEKISE